MKNAFPTSKNPFPQIVKIPYNLLLWIPFLHLNLNKKNIFYIVQQVLLQLFFQQFLYHLISKLEKGHLHVLH
uniref:Ovule protein n=1 Tax=Meloidogyne incognita TaxID=6306 RepID=A0A914MZI5_MELIC